MVANRLGGEEIMATGTIIYKCSCGAYHPWAFDGDCRDDDNRYTSPEEYPKKIV